MKYEQKVQIEMSEYICLVKRIDGVVAQKTLEQELIRCKDCKHYGWSDNRAFGYPCKRCEVTGFEDIDDNDFCSRGERKE